MNQFKEYRTLIFMGILIAIMAIAVIAKDICHASALELCQADRAAKTIELTKYYEDSIKTIRHEMAHERACKESYQWASKTWGCNEGIVYQQACEMYKFKMDSLDRKFFAKP